MHIYSFEGLKKGTLIDRPNRYLANVLLDGAALKVHVHDPGRLKELLYAGNACYVKHMPGDKRKTQWDLIAAAKGDEFVLVHSGHHRYIAEALLNRSEQSPFGALKSYKPEVTYGESRLDFKLLTETQEIIWVEVKGCSLSVDQIARFPDAPTVRGTKHLNTLIQVRQAGERAAVLLLVLSEATAFEPNNETDPLFSKTFYEALDQGVEVYPVQLKLDIQKGSISYVKTLPILGR